MKKLFCLWLGIMVSISLLMGMMLSGCGASPASPISAQETTGDGSLLASTTLPDKAPREGIKVHGHWTIEVKNPDGTLIESRDFENALFPEGKARLAEILTRQYSVGGWAIWAGTWGSIYDNYGNSPFFNPDFPGVPSPCRIMEIVPIVLRPFEFANLTIGTGNGSQVVLRGTAIAQKNGIIASVSTFIGLRPNTEPPAIDYADWPLTRAIVDPPIPVVQGQSILFTVVLSFS